MTSSPFSKVLGVFPHPLLTPPDGVNYISPTLKTQDLLTAYKAGIFPWYTKGEWVQWHFPDHRMLLFPERIHISKSMRPYFNQGKFQITHNQCFLRIVKACNKTRPENSSGGWIHPPLINAYWELYKMGYIHSLEVWDRNHQLAGGLYGIAIGRIFMGESMFHYQRDASKFALICLAKIMETLPQSLIDCQLYTPHLEKMGGRPYDKVPYWQVLRSNLLEKENLIAQHIEATLPRMEFSKDVDQ